MPEWEELDARRAGRAATRARATTYNGSDLVRVVDDDMDDVPADGETLGEIVMRGNSVITGYWNKADETEEAFEGGWFHSGDIGGVAPRRLRRAARPRART